MIISLIVLSGAGLFFLLGAIFNWDFLIAGRQRGFFALASLLGRTVTRVVYGVAGVVFIGIGIFTMFI